MDKGVIVPEKFELSHGLITDIINVLNAYKTLSPSPIVGAVLARLDSELRAVLESSSASKTPE